MISESSSKKSIALSIKYLAIRNRSKREILEYLQRKSVSKADQEVTLEYLDAKGLIDDTAFALQWSQMRLRQGKGDRLIRFELFKKGIDSQIIDQAFGVIPDEDWFFAIKQSLAKKKASFQSTNYLEQQAARKVLYQKGFSKHYIDAFLHNEVQ